MNSAGNQQNIGKASEQERRPRFMIRRVINLGLCAWLLGVPATGFALPRQSSTAAVEGRVHDPSDAALAGATVRLTNLDTSRHREVRTASDGTFQFLAVPPGRYRLIVSLDGF